jgi:hypothetical protein
MGGKWLRPPASVWDKEGALIPVSQAELKVWEGFLYIVVDATFHFSQTELQQFGSFSQRSSGGPLSSSVITGQDFLEQPSPEPDQDSHLISLSLSQISNVAGTRRDIGDLNKSASQKVPFPLEEI